ncbi:MAG: transcriptional regulator [Anaerolineae bacterium]|nr:transcriptional regulator [Phycisphaerae bacterium]
MAGNKPHKSSDPKEAGRFAYEGLERLLHERSRLGILSSLAAHPEGVIFNDLKLLCSLTDGNLSRQIQILEEAGFVEVIKSVHKNRPRTLCRLTTVGRRKFVDYLSELERVVHDAAQAQDESTRGHAISKHLRPT